MVDKSDAATDVVESYTREPDKLNGRAVTVSVLEVKL